MTGEMGAANMWFPQLQALGWGRMFTRYVRSPYDGERVALDNGAYTCWTKGLPWDQDRWLRNVEGACAHADAYELAVLPDRVADPSSLEFSLGWLEQVRDYPLPWYLAVQDGMTPAQIEPLLGRFAGLFLGGSDAFKATAETWCRLAHRHGKRFHYARVGTPRKIQLARECGADSADSSRPVRSRKLFREFADFWRGYQPQGELFDAGKRDALAPRRRYGFETRRVLPAAAPEQRSLDL